MTATEFCTTHGITATARKVTQNPAMPDWKDADHWRVTLMRGDKGTDYAVLRTTFSKGFGHHGKAPSASEVLACLVMDAAPFSHGISFEDWADEYGYDTDSRKAERIYKYCDEAADKLQAFLGRDLFAAVTTDGLDD